MPEKKREIIKDDIKNLFNHYKNDKKVLFLHIFYSLALFFFSLVISGGKIFYPFHFLISLLVIIWSLKLLKDGILTYNNKLKTPRLIQKIYKKYNKIIFIVTIMLIFGSIYLVVQPPFINPFEGQSKDELKTMIKSDTKDALLILDSMDEYGNRLIESEIYIKEIISEDLRQQYKSDWDSFILTLQKSEAMAEKYRFFHQLPFGHLNQNTIKAFIISYSLYIKKYSLFHQLMQRAQGDESAKKILNEKITYLDRGNYYDEISRYFYHPKTIIKINAAYIYLKYINLFKKANCLDEECKILKENTINSYQYLIKNIDLSIWLAFKVGGEKIEKEMFTAWFPIQKNTANLMGEINIARREKKFITIEQIQEMKKYLEPGDILLERRNWYLSNIGIPGFWPHAALYLGEINEADEYFKNEFPYMGYEKFSNLLKNEYNDFWKVYNKKDKYDFAQAVIEGKAEGILLHSLEESAHADYVAVLRPRLGRLDKLKAIQRAIGNYGKPYDYNFDFETKDALVCSELVYDAYLPLKGKQGLDFILKTMNGRKIISPTDMAEKFYQEREKEDRQLDFVYFIDGNEKLGKAFVRGEAEFLTTWTRPKYDWSQE